MRDILDALVVAAEEQRDEETNRLLSLARERIAAGDACAGRILKKGLSASAGDRAAENRHAAAVKACEKEVQQHD